MGEFGTGMQGWTGAARRNVMLVFKDSAQDTIELMARTQPSITESGTYVEGRVPKLSGDLIASLEYSLNGGAAIAGEVSYVAIIAAMQPGDAIEVVFTEIYAKAQEYGGVDESGEKIFPGRYFVRNAVQSWPQTVDANAARYVEK